MWKKLSIYHPAKSNEHIVFDRKTPFNWKMVTLIVMSEFVTKFLMSLCLSVIKLKFLGQNACRMFQNVQECMQNVLECCRMHAVCSRMFQNIPEYYRMYAECSRLFQNVPECMQNVPECSRIHAKCMQNVPECS